MKIGVMNKPTASVYDEIESFGQANYDFVDLTIEGPNALDLDVERVRALLDQYHLFVVGHTDPCLPYAYPVKGVREACFKELERSAKLFSSLGAKVMNIHPCYSCPPRMKQDLIKQNIEALQPIVQMAGSLGLTLIFENYKTPFDRVSTFDILLEEVPGLKVHLDFGHTNMGEDDAETFCRLLGRHIMHVHFSDNRSTEDHHMPLGVGSVDWKKAVSALKMIEYDGTITLEIFCDDDTVLFQYLDISRRLLLNLWNP
jgi:sugar phosphate isomerase/epimerase